jgi:hypothetical protein
MKPRWEAEAKRTPDYNLCSSCYKKSRCDSRLFYKIDQTHVQGPKPTGTRAQEDPRAIKPMSKDVSGDPMWVSTGFSDGGYFIANFNVQIYLNGIGNGKHYVIINTSSEDSVGKVKIESLV